MQWVNDNVAPTYLRWQVVFVLDGPVHIELPAAFDMRSVIDAAVVDVETLHPAHLSSGTYQALLRVEDVQAISPPMFLAMQGRDSSGNYLLGRSLCREQRLNRRRAFAQANLWPRAGGPWAGALAHRSWGRCDDYPSEREAGFP